MEKKKQQTLCTLTLHVIGYTVHNNMVDTVLAFKNLENYRNHLKAYREIKCTNIKKH